MSVLPNYVRYLPRLPKFDLDTVTAQELFTSAIKKLHNYDILITHATSPLIKPQSIREAINIYHSKENYDSVVACRKYKKYAWFRNSTLNYNLEKVNKQMILIQ